jgi:hypothetical protein
MCRFVAEVLITKDLITYEIDSSKKPISMHEAVEGTGTSLFQVVKLVQNEVDKLNRWSLRRHFH